MASERAPKVKVFGHVDLLKDIHQPLFFCWFFNLEVGADGDHFGAFAMVDVVSSQKGDDGAFHDEDDVPSGCKFDKSSDTVKDFWSAQAPGGFVAVVEHFQHGCHLFSAVLCIVFNDVELVW